MNSISKWMNDLIRLYFKADSEINKNFVIDKFLFFMTITFDQNRISNRMSEISSSNYENQIEYDDFNILYCSLNQALFGKRWNRDKWIKSLPLALVFLDFEGTRYSPSLPESSNNAHLHIIWAVRPPQMENFSKFFTSPRFKTRLLDKLHIDQIQLKPFDSRAGSIQNLTSYSAKAWTKSQNTIVSGEMFRVYPNRNYSPTPYRMSRQYRNESRRIQKLRTESAKYYASRKIQ